MMQFDSRLLQGKPGQTVQFGTLLPEPFGHRAAEFLSELSARSLPGMLINVVFALGDSPRPAVSAGPDFPY